MHRYLAVGLLLALAALLGPRLLIRRAAEPSYAGKRASQWLDAGYEDSAMAIQEIGPAAGPYILAKLAEEDPQYGTSRPYRWIWTKVPASLRWTVPQPKAGTFGDLRATSALLELGPPITPLLASRLKDKNPAVRCACARTLGALRQQGTDIRRALPALTEALKDPNSQVAALAFAAIGDSPKPATGR